MSFRTQFFLIVFLLLSVNARARVVAPRFSKSAILAGLVSSNRNYSHKWAYQADAPNANIVANYGNAATLEALEGMRLTTRGWCFNSRWGSLSWIWDGIDFDATAANFTDKLITLGMRTTSVAITCYESEDDSDIGAAKFILLSVRPNEDVKFKMSVFRADRAVREFAEIENTSMRPGDEVCIKDTDPTADSYRRFKAYHRLVGETEWTEISTSALVGTSPQSGFSCLSAGAGRLPEGNHQFRVVVEPFQNHLPKRANYNFNVKVIAPPSPSPSPSPTPTPTRTPTPTPTPTPTRTPSPTPNWS